MSFSPRLGPVSGVVVFLLFGTAAVPLYARDEPARAAGEDADEGARVAGLVKALQDDNALVRKRAAIALGRLGPGARAAVPALEKALHDADADVRAAAAAALEKVDVRLSLDALVRRLQDRGAPDRLRREACRELAERFGKEPAATRALEGVLTDPAVKADAARALEDIDRGAQAQPPAVAGPRTALVKGLPNLLLRRPEGKDRWQRLPAEGGTVADGDTVLALPGYRGEVKFPSGAGLLLWGNLPEFLDVPLLESAVVLHPAAGADLDLTLDRGRALVANRKAAGPVKVRVRFPGGDPKAAEAWELTLDEPGTEVGLDLFARYTADIPYRKDGGDAPLAEFYLVVLQGQASVKTGANTYTLRAPPAGPSLLSWDSKGPGTHTPEQVNPQMLRFWDKARPQTDAADRAEAALREMLQRVLGGAPDKPVESVLEESLQADRPSSRVLGVFCLGAVEAVGKVLDALADDDEHRGDLRDAAVIALRHWIGRRADNQRRLDEVLVNEKHFTPGQAERVLQLLHDFAADARREPETWEALIASLKSDRDAVRTLAYWHLYRLVPEGRAPAYNPAGDGKRREAAYEAWKKLIPDGKLPPERRPAPR